MTVKTTTRRWRMMLPLGALVLLAFLWSLYWVVASRAAQSGLEAWIDREALRGRIYLCPQRELTGYPFRIEIACTAPSAELGAPGQRVRLTATKMRAVAQIYNFNHAIAEFEGPISLTPLDQPSPLPPLIIRSPLVRASLKVRPTELDALDVVLEQPEIAIAAASAAPRALARAEIIAAHSRKRPDAPAGSRDYDVAARAVGLVVAPRNGQPPSTLDKVEMLGTVFALPQQVGEDAADTLRRWQSGGGSFGLAMLSVESGAALVQADGRLALDVLGFINGEVRAKLASPEAALAAAGLAGDASRLAATALGLVGRPSTIGEKQAVGVDIAIKAGEVSIGPVLLGRVAPLF